MPGHNAYNLVRRVSPLHVPGSEIKTAEKHGMAAIWMSFTWLWYKAKDTSLSIVFLWEPGAQPQSGFSL